MAKKETEIIEKFEGQLYVQDVANLERNIADIENIISKLGANGLDVDLEHVKDFANMSKQDLIALVNRMYREYIGRLGRVIPAEKQRIAESYSQLVDDCWPLIAQMKDKLNNCNAQFIEVDGKITIDIEQVKQTLEERHTHRFNMSKIQEYYSVVKGVADALDKVKKWERTNGLQCSFTDDSFAYDTEETRKYRNNGIAVPMQEVNTWKFIRELNEEEFKKVVFYRFEV